LNCTQTKPGCTINCFEPSKRTKERTRNQALEVHLIKGKTVRRSH